MKKITNSLDIIGLNRELKNKTIIDMGCGTGDLVRLLSKQEARLIGIDRLNMLKKAREHPPVGNESYICGVGEYFSFRTQSAEMILFMASLHHVPETLMTQALSECHRVLKPRGTAVILEPMGLDGSYYEIVKLVNDEREIQRLAYEAIQQAQRFGLAIKEEEIIYFERSFADYEDLLNDFVDDPEDRNRYIEEARKTTERMSREAGVSFADFRYRSIARVNVLEKI